MLVKTLCVLLLVGLSFSPTLFLSLLTDVIFQRKKKFSTIFSFPIHDTKIIKLLNSYLRVWSRYYFFCFMLSCFLILFSWIFFPLRKFQSRQFSIERAWLNHFRQKWTQKKKNWSSMHKYILLQKFGIFFFKIFVDLIYFFAP